METPEFLDWINTLDGTSQEYLEKTLKDFRTIAIEMVPSPTQTYFETFLNINGRYFHISVKITDREDEFGIKLIKELDADEYLDLILETKRNGIKVGEMPLNGKDEVPE